MYNALHRPAAARFSGRAGSRPSEVAEATTVNKRFTKDWGKHCKYSFEMSRAYVICSDNVYVLM